MRRAHRLGVIALAGLVVALCAAAALAGGTTLPTTTLLPVTSTGDVTTQSTPFLAWIEDLTPDAYLEEEYSVAGQANVYGYADDAARSPAVMVQETLPYKTRILVRRPTSPGRFNGTVYFEVLNATAGWDGDPIWQATHEYLIREGAIWVGMTTKPNTVNFLKNVWGKPTFPTRNASRYADLAMPHFGQVWDMMSQLGALLKSPGAAGNPLVGFDVQRLIMVGYSQSAAYETTYANSIHATMTNGSPVFDGYYIAAGGSRAKHVTGPPPTAQESLPVGDPRNRTNVNVPVIRFQTQFEVVNSGAYLVRQNEATDPMVRFYEGAGLTHVDAYLNAIGGQALARDLGLPPSFCPNPAIPHNPIRNGYVQAALLEALDNWIASGATPPASRYLELTATNTLARDADGNAIGGIRPPDIQVPLGRYVETNTGPGFCGLFGGFEPFSAAKLKALYRNHGTYVSRYTKAVQENVQDGFLLSEDAEAQREAAAQGDVGK